jgi:hypothetical protein
MFFLGKAGKVFGEPRRDHERVLQPWAEDAI